MPPQGVFSDRRASGLHGEALPLGRCRPREFLGPNCPSTCSENSLRRIQGIKSLPDNSPAMDTQDHWAAASAWTNARRTSSPSKAASTICTQWTHKIISHVLRVRMQAIAAEGFGRYLEKPDRLAPVSSMLSRRYCFGTSSSCRLHFGRRRLRSTMPMSRSSRSRETTNRNRCRSTRSDRSLKSLNHSFRMNRRIRRWHRSCCPRHLRKIRFCCWTRHSSSSLRSSRRCFPSSSTMNRRSPRIACPCRIPWSRTGCSSCRYRTARLPACRLQCRRRRRTRSISLRCPCLPSRRR